MSTGTSPAETAAANRAAPAGAGSLDGNPTALGLPLIYTAVFVLVDLALLLSFLGVNESSAGAAKAGGYAAFAVLGVYLFASTASVATGGRALPLGRPLLR